MRLSLRLGLLAALSLAAFAPSSFAQLNIPSDGSDGALIITANTNIDLRLAVTGTWSDNNSGNAGKGIYDPNKWAVVFKYSSVLISNGATVTFTNHLTHAPVVWLVQSNVTIEGTLNLNGQSANIDVAKVPEPGPGGFRGGARNLSAYGLGAGGGFGPGGNFSLSGSYANSTSYGNLQILPLIGGSGGGAGQGTDHWNGGGGGGAILIAASRTITINGSLTANGGDGYPGGISVGYPGSGGGIRLVANQIFGSGVIQAISQQYPGRIRLEANSTGPDLRLNPITSAALPSPLVIWPEATAPTVKVVSVGGQSAPVDPKAQLAGPASDLTIANTNTVTIILQSSDFPTNGTVNVYVKPRNGAQSILPASLVSGDASLATWQVTTTLLPAYSVIQARAVAP